MKREPTTVYASYNSVAAYRGWLPIGIGLQSDARTLRDAADRIEWQNRNVAVALRCMANIHAKRDGAESEAR